MVNPMGMEDKHAIWQDGYAHGRDDAKGMILASLVLVAAIGFLAGACISLVVGS